MSDFAYSCARPSALEEQPAGNALLLPAFFEGVDAETTCFFWGRLRNSWLAARGLSTLAKVVASRFVPQSAALRARIVTAGAGQLRFEAFSPRRKQSAGWFLRCLPAVNSRRRRLASGWWGLAPFEKRCPWNPAGYFAPALR